MTRNSDTGETVYPRALRDTKSYGERRSPRATDTAASGAPGANTGEESGRLIKSARRQIEILTERNIDLQKELAALVKRETQARHLAYHDGLTGLPNRSMLQDRFRQARFQADRHHKPLALLMVGLDELKRVNDKLGHASGDRLLQAVALRLTKGIRGADTACRYGGAEFVIMLPEIDSPMTAAALAAKIGRRLSEPYVVDGHKIHIAVSVGIAVYPRDGRTFHDLMKQVTVAMNRTQGAGHGTAVTEPPADNAGEPVHRRS
jgi:diguanylate cyclase